MTGILSAFADESHKIAFQRNNEIWIANLDGMEARKLLEGNLPEISPDGTRVAFNTEDLGEKLIRRIAIADISSGAVTVFEDVPSDNSFGPVWSPDGKSLLFSILAEDRWHLATIDADGKGFRFVRKTEVRGLSFHSPAWAADGTSFFCHDLNAIYRFDLDGNLMEKWPMDDIVPNGELNSSSRLAASPDGKSLLIEVDMDEEQNRENWDGPPPAIWHFDLESKKATRVTQKNLFAWEPFWINEEEFLFTSRPEDEEEETSLYRCSLKQRDYQMVIKNADLPSVSR